MKWFPGCNRTYVELRRDGLTIRFPLSIIRYDSDDSGHADEYFTENSTSNLVDRARATRQNMFMNNRIISVKLSGHSNVKKWDDITSIVNF